MAGQYRVSECVFLHSPTRSLALYLRNTQALLPPGSELLNIKNVLLPSACELVSNKIIF
jgi:hypothetical protein